LCRCAPLSALFFFPGGGTLDRWVQDIVLAAHRNGRLFGSSQTHCLQRIGVATPSLVGQDLASAGNRRYADDAQLNNLTVRI
jgi:hypothetical protein